MVSEQVTVESPWVRAPAWLLSLAAHLAAFILGLLLIRVEPPAIDQDEGDRRAAIVLAERTARKTNYFSDEGQASARHSVQKPAAGIAASPVGGGGPTIDKPPLIPGISLPQLPGSLPVGDGLVPGPQPGVGRGRGRLPSGIDEAAIRAEDALIPREVVPTGPTAQLSLFGSATAVGRSFVFVIDRSQSMGGDGLGAIQEAAKELTLRLSQLSAEQTFQVVAYNEVAAYLTGRELLSATEKNKRKLIRFVADLAAYGQTEHSRGLMAALRLKPEVIFLLTDGGDPELNPAQLKLIREHASRTSIHCLHFGRGKLDKPSQFLERLAAQNHGSYTYIDMRAR